MELIFQEGDLLVKTLTTHEEAEEALRLRHDVFREELRWVPPSADGLDRDEYDSYAQGIGIFNATGELVGHVRLILAPETFMIEKDFSMLLPDDGSFRKSPGMAESTRICIRKDERSDRHMSMTLAHLLYKAMYHWSRLNDIKTLITIVEKRYYLLLKRSRFPFNTVGDFQLLGEGVMSGIISMDWRRVDAELRVERPDFYGWLVNLPALVPEQLQRLGLYLRH
jgi:N-acyl-L-homoserine lactone synthetase